MSTYILGFQEIDKTKLLQWLGAKAPTWENYPGLKDVQVPEGFCITTEVYKEIIGNNEAFNSSAGSVGHSKSR